MTDHEHGGDATPSVPTNLQPSPTAAEMADALRSGVAVRRRLDERAPGADAARLGVFGDLEGLGPVAKPGAAAPAVRFVRRVLQTFIRPWLAKQTIFNHEIARHADESATIVRDLRRRVPLIEDGMHILEARIRTMELRAAGDAGVVSSALDPAPLQRMFVHSRLPPPPASVLLIGNVAPEIEVELRSLGYGTVREHAPESGDRGDTSDARRNIDAVVATVHAAGAAVSDDTIWGCLDAASHELPLGGRAVVLIEVPCGPEHIKAVTEPQGASVRTPWRCRERLVFATSGWSVVSTDPPPDVTVMAMTLTIDQSAHASHR
jgi:hypothetical protein